MTKRLKDWKSHHCILEVDLEYPKELHDLHNEYLLAPERLTVNKVEKLLISITKQSRFYITKISSCTRALA